MNVAKQSGATATTYGMELRMNVSERKRKLVLLSGAKDECGTPISREVGQLRECCVGA